MSPWLNGLAAALDARSTPALFFFRDDDAGWRDDRLQALLDGFADAGIGIDLAVIPAALSPRLAADLERRRAADPARLGLHQHGYRHDNHEVGGRKCEFGAARDHRAQRHDLAAGALLLAAHLPVVDPIFTPPWNRCSEVAAACLGELGIEVLSRDVGAAPLRLAGLRELPVAIDWCKRVGGSALSPVQRADAIAARLAGEQPVGIMLHHAVMDDDDLLRVGELLALLARHGASRCHLMRELAPAAATTQPVPAAAQVRAAA